MTELLKSKKKSKQPKKKIVIIGGGLTGLLLGYYFSKSNDFEITIVEKQGQIGGIARSIQYKGFNLDFGPHKIYTEIPGIMEEIKKIVPLSKIKKKNSIYLKNNFFDFPLKILQIAQKMPFTALNSGIDIFTKSFSKLPDDSYENFLINRFGKTMYELAFKDYARKVWALNPKEIDKELAIRRIPISNIFELIKSTLLNRTKKIAVEYFHYPPKGIEQIIKNLSRQIKKANGKILLKMQISEIKIDDAKAIQYIKIGKKKIKPDYLISTICLDHLLDLIKTKSKEVKEVKQFAVNLEYQSINLLYLLLNKPRALKDCWVFFPEKKFLFHRICEQRAFSKLSCPPNKTALMVETSKCLNEDNINKIILQLETLGILKRCEIEKYLTRTELRVYPLYKKGFLGHRDKVVNYIESIKDFYTIGRSGLFNYNSMDQCWDMAKKTFEHIKQGKTKQDWQKTKKYFDNYRIVD